MSTRMYVMTHKEFKLMPEEFYVPVHAGAAISKPLPYLRDDSGENISVKNKAYCELTGMYWVWKNSDFEGNIGICSYRRYFMAGNFGLLDEEMADKILEKYDAITSVSLDNEEGTVLEQYDKHHYKKDLLLAGEAIKELYPSDYPYFEEHMKSVKSSCCNMMVMKRALYNEYCEWLFGVLSYVEKKADTDGYDDYNKRIYGFIAERLLDVFLKARGKTSYQFQVILLKDERDEKLAKLYNELAIAYEDKDAIKASAIFDNCDVSFGEMAFEDYLNSIGIIAAVSLIKDNPKLCFKNFEKFDILHDFVINVLKDADKILRGFYKRPTLERFNAYPVTAKDLASVMKVYQKELLAPYLSAIAIENYKNGFVTNVIPLLSEALELDPTNRKVVECLVVALDGLGFKEEAENYRKLL